MHVSVSAFDDADLLRGCLDSVRDVCPDATVQVVDGKYATWPDGDANSTDGTPDVAESYGASYVAGGPYDRERDKHVHRVALAPDGERCLLLDADERLLAYDRDALADGVAYQSRIYNALVYGPRAVYWPRLFDPATVTAIDRWDAYQFDVPCERTDAVTLVHRHDLRGRAYREAKYDRFDAEGRTGRYDDRLETYLADDWDAEMHPCPACGRDSVTRSQATPHGPDGTYSRVEACVAGDRCHARTVALTVGEWRYLPDAVDRGFDEDPERLRLELLDAGCGFARVPAERLAAAFQPATRLWVGEHLGGREDVVA